MHRKTRRHSSQGFTLIEILMTVCVLGLLSVASYGWVSSLGRQSRLLGQAAQEQRQNAEIISLLCDDCLLARGTWTFDEQVLRVKTLNSLPGQDPGLYAVEWSFDSATGALYRKDARVDSARLILKDLETHPITQDPDGSLWWQRKGERHLIIRKSL